MVGAAANSDLLTGRVDLDDRVFVMTTRDVHEPLRAAIFAVGDVRSGSVKRGACAVGVGSAVISKARGHVHA